METDACIKEAVAAVAAHAGNAPLVVGVSGGADSVALLHILLSQSSNPVFAAHLHHGIRGAQADADADFVRKLCKELSVPCTIQHADTPAYATAHGMSIEEAARTLRYSFLRETLTKTGARFVVTAHHMDDQAETILMHLLRGAGLSGLCGMRTVSGDILRPLLCVPRAEILRYVAAHNLPFCTDETNFDTAYTRNRIRMELMPALKTYNPAIVQTLSNMAALLQEDEDLLTAQAKSALHDARVDAGVYHKEPLAQLPNALKSRAVRLILLHEGALYGAGQATIARVCKLLTARTGAKVLLPGGKLARISYGTLCIANEEAPAAMQDTMLHVPGDTHTPFGVFRAEEVPALHKHSGALVAYFDWEQLPKEMTVRMRRPADTFYPLGAPGTRKLKEYLIDKKIPREKRNVPLLAHGEQVLFFPGGTSAHPYRVTDETRRILRITYIPTDTKDTTK
ncbi:tRNA lysidine(34) synthetase TilS [Christensenellaceae bacterium OttesenSCG-928-L17]|nr:tRNA lysidine(34) synthetase TilS [Christensenellaceae bacterium OttesenSCG-928-L17]